LTLWGSLVRSQYRPPPQKILNVQSSFMIAFTSGVASGLALIIAIGAQNAFVIRQGLQRQHVLIVVLLCAISDALLIAAGTAGLGRVIESAPQALEIVRWFGVTYLAFFGIKSVRSAFRHNSLTLEQGEVVSRKRTVFTVLGLTFLNPHVYLDTVIFLGSIANQFPTDKWLFSSGAMVASFLWFFSIGFGSTMAARFMVKVIFWKVLDLSVAAIMFTLATYLIFYSF
jgi:L-lysine exporter family protein LysE/ArgO